MANGKNNFTSFVANYVCTPHAMQGVKLLCMSYECYSVLAQGSKTKINCVMYAIFGYIQLKKGLAQDEINQ